MNEMGKLGARSGVKWAWFARSLFVLVGASVSLALIAWAWTLQQVNQQAPALTQAEARHSYLRAVAWLKVNESSVLSQGNAALWWMVDTAAQRSGDPYLSDLVERHLSIAYQGPFANSPWVRFVRPQALVKGGPQPEEQLVRYQRFFLTAVTCRADDDTRDFLEGHVCRPALSKVWLADPVCSTHHLMGLMIHRRSGCEPAPEAERLQGELLDDIEAQARLDPSMRDAVLQRVLMLAWAGGVERPSPSWVQRVRDAQQPDGGWTGEASLPEWPDFLQPQVIRGAWRRLNGRPHAAPPSDFHASAQGLLLMALLAHPAGKTAPAGQ